MTKEAINTERALKLALDALDEFCELGAIIRPLEVRDALRVALASRGEALANEALDRMSENARELGLDYETHKVEQPAQPPATYTCGVCGVSMQMEQPPQQDMPKIGCVNHDCDKCKAQPQQEPVAELVVSQYSGGKRLDIEWNLAADVMAFALGRLPLYTSPPAQRKPLTDEQIIQIASTPDGSQATTKGYVIPFVRAIEAAHGIKEKNT